MTEGSLPYFNPIDDEFFGERVDNYKKRSTILRSNRKAESTGLDSENVSINQERNDLIFEFFNTLRVMPNQFLREAELYDLGDLIQSAVENSNSNISHLIKNPFYNLLFESIINKVKGDKDDIMEELNEDSQMKNYKKQLFLVESASNEPRGIVWKLLKDNKNIALKEFFLSKIDYLIISTYSVHHNNQVTAYFLFLKRNKN